MENMKLFISDINLLLKKYKYLNINIFKYLYLNIYNENCCNNSCH